MRIAGAGHAFPPHFYNQDELLAAAEAQWRDQLYNTDRLAQLFTNVMVGGRHLALPLEQYATLDGFGQANDAWIRVALDVGAESIERAVAAAGLALSDVDALFTVSVTGLATPSLDARLMNRLDLPANLKRTPIFGLGCVAGAAGIARAADYVRAFPGHVAVLLSVELCSLTLQREDLSIANLISSGLFGDGAAAVVVTGADRDADRPARSWPPARRSTPIPSRSWAGTSPSAASTSSSPPTCPRWSKCTCATMSTPSSPSRVCAAPTSPLDRPHRRSQGARRDGAVALELPDDALDLTWKSLREVGNLSSTSVLLVLEETLQDRRPSRLARPALRHGTRILFRAGAPRVVTAG